MKHKIGLFIPTYNAVENCGDRFRQTLANIAKANLDRVLIIDSSSLDNTVQLVDSFGFEVQVIPQSEFDHGGTRQLGLTKLSDCEVVIFLTQDAYIKDVCSLQCLIQPILNNSDIGATYGRQIAFDDANIFAKYLRMDNYGVESYVLSYPDRYSYGMRCVFASNSFAAYNVRKVMQLGGFPEKIILGEDVFIFAKLLIAGYKVQYVANSLCYHSHNYNIIDEFRRYFDIGVFHRTNLWIIEHFNGVESDGFNYILSEFKYVIRHKPFKIHLSIIKNLAKYIGYKFGHNYLFLSKKMCRKLSMNKYYWDNEHSV